MNWFVLVMITLLVRLFGWREIQLPFRVQNLTDFQSYSYFSELRLPSKHWAIKEFFKTFETIKLVNSRICTTLLHNEFPKIKEFALLSNEKKDSLDLNDLIIS